MHGLYFGGHGGRYGNTGTKNNPMAIIMSMIKNTDFFIRLFIDLMF